jgi:N-acetylmuramoyl-L-alanine amidase
MSTWNSVNPNRPPTRAPGESASWSWRDPGGSSSRRLSAAERRALRDRRDGRGEHIDGEPGIQGTGRPVPRMPKTRQDTRVRSPLITLAGTLLIIGLTVLAFAGGRLFGRVEEPPPPEVAAVEVVVPPPGEPAENAAAPVAPVEEPEEVTPIPLPAAFSRAPVICIDPGHGGSDRGFLRFFENDVPTLEEATLVLEQAWDLEARLLHRGYKVVMTRETDAAVNLEGRDVNGDGRTAAHDPPRSDRNETLDEIQARINICNKAGADLLVSMHLNGYSTATPRGYETWFTRERPFGDRNAAFATLAYQHLKEQLGRLGYVLPQEEERGVLPDTTADVQEEHGTFEHFIITGPEIPGVVKPSKMPGAIVEALFMTNDGDAAVLTTQEGRTSIVNAYENAIVEYFEWYPPEKR